METSLVADALGAAVARRGSDAARGVVFHTDYGSKYTSAASKAVSDPLASISQGMFSLTRYVQPHKVCSASVTTSEQMNNVGSYACARSGEGI